MLCDSLNLSFISHYSFQFFTKVLTVITYSSQTNKIVTTRTFLSKIFSKIKKKKFLYKYLFYGTVQCVHSNVIILCGYTYFWFNCHLKWWSLVFVAYNNCQFCRRSIFLLVSFLFLFVIIIIFFFVYPFTWCIQYIHANKYIYLCI